jgi:hypothetical protein
VSYTVDGASGNTLGIADAPSDESGMRGVGGNAARDAPLTLRQSSQVAIKLETCHNGEVNHIHSGNSRVAGVRLDSQSQYHRVSNILDSGQLAPGYADHTCLGADRPANRNVQNLRVHNQVVYTWPRDFSALHSAPYLGRRDLDGLEASLASAAIDVGPVADGAKAAKKVWILPPELRYTVP